MSEQDSMPTSDPHLPASEADTGIIPDIDAEGDETSKPASEADMVPDEAVKAEPQSWPGKSFGSIPPPG